MHKNKSTKHFSFFSRLTLLAVLASFTGHAWAFSLSEAVIAGKSLIGGASHSFPAQGTMEVAFSPNEGGERLIIKVINSAAREQNGEILMLAYSFTSAPVVQALLNAMKQGVTVRLVADYKNNVSQDRSGKARAALSALKTAGADVRLIKKYAIHHDKVIIVNRKTVELGSFNFSAAAEKRNSENVLVNWNNPDLAKAYTKHFHRNYQQASEFSLQY